MFLWTILLDLLHAPLPCFVVFFSPRAGRRRQGYSRLADCSIRVGFWCVRPFLIGFVGLADLVVDLGWLPFLLRGR